MCKFKTIKSVSRCDDSFRLENKMGKTIAFVDRFDITLQSAVTHDELNDINDFAGMVDFMLQIFPEK